MSPEAGLDVLIGHIAAAGLTASNGIFEGAPHGYTMADTASWNEPAFVRAFTILRDLYARTLN